MLANRGNVAMAFRIRLNEAVPQLSALLVNIYAQLDEATDTQTRNELVAEIIRQVTSFIKSSNAGQSGAHVAYAAMEASNLSANVQASVPRAFDLAVHELVKTRRLEPPAPATPALHRIQVDSRMPAHVSGLKGHVDAVILTIRQDEDRAVAGLLGKLQPTTGGRSYRVATLEGDRKKLTVALLRLTEPGNGPAQDAARDAIAELAPRMLFLVGIAGAVPASEFTLGDVIAATRIVDVRIQALVAGSPPQLEVRGERVDKALADRLNNLIEPLGWSDSVTLPRPQAPLEPHLFGGTENWKDKVRRSLEVQFHAPGRRDRPVYFTGTVAASDHLVKDPAALEHWLQSSRKIEAVEMEAAGVMEAATRLDATYPVLVVRGISDIVGYERDPAWTAYACQSAAAFAVALLRSGQVDDIHP